MVDIKQELIARTPKSRELHARSSEVLAAEIVQTVDMPHPFYVAEAKGSRLTDVDGNEYIDLTGGYGPIVLGHAPDAVVAAVQAQAQLGLHVGLHNPHQERLARLITEPPRHLHVLDFEVLVTQPERELARCCAFLDLPFEPRALSYQASDWPKDGPGDPMRIHRYHRPEPTRAHAWVARLAVDAPARRCVERQLAAVTDRDLETLGHPSTSLWDPLGIVGREPSDDRGGWSRYALERRALLGLRRAARHRGVRPWIERARLACEILLRDGFAPEESTGRSEEE